MNQISEHKKTALFEAVFLMSLALTNKIMAVEQVRHK